jgi:tetratricopeptide (TPR) repeat protein
MVSGAHIFDLQDRVVTELLSGLRFKASSSEVAPILSPDTIHLEAYEQYAEGKRLFHRPGRSNLDEAKQRFERALALDPGNAAAHGGLGATFAMLYIRRTDPDDLLRALTHLQRALQLDAELSQPIPFWPMPVGGKERLSWHERWARKPSADSPT